MTVIDLLINIINSETEIKTETETEKEKIFETEISLLHIASFSAAYKAFRIMLTSLALYETKH